MAVSVVHSQVYSQAWSGTLTNAPTIGNSLIIGTTWFSTSSGAGTTTGVTYGGTSGTPVKYEEQRSPSANRVATAIWIIPNLGSSNTSWSVTWNPASGSATVVGAVVLEVAGLGASPTLETHAGNAGATGSVDSGSSGTATAGDLIVGMAVQFGAAFTPPGAPWTNLNIGGVNDSVLGYQILASGGTVNYPGAGASSADWAASVVAVLPTASGVSAALTVAQETIAALPLSPKIFLPLTVAQEAVAAPAPAPKLKLALPVAQETISAPAPSPKLKLALPVAQVNVNAPAPSAHVGGASAALAVAQVAIGAPAPTAHVGPVSASLPVAQINVSAPAPTATAGGLAKALTTAQVAIAAPALTAHVGPVSAALATAQVAVTAPAPTVHTGSFLPPPAGAGGGSVSWALPGGKVTSALPGGSVK